MNSSPAAPPSSGSAARSVLLTGGSRGIGRAAALALLRRGHSVLLTSRSAERGATVVDELRTAVPDARISSRPLDLASLRSVRDFATGLRHDHVPVDVLVHNAGVLRASRVRDTTADGFEATLATNTLGPFLLTHELLPTLLAGGTARIVSVSSRLHARGSRGREVDLDLDDPQLTRGYHPDRAYKNSKLALLWVHRELARRADRTGLPLECVAVCPGFVPVTAATGTHGLERVLLTRVLPRLPFATSLPDAADTVAAAALDVPGDVDRLVSPDGGIDLSPDARDPERAGRFWDLACRLVGIEDWP